MPNRGSKIRRLLIGFLLLGSVLLAGVFFLTPGNTEAAGCPGTSDCSNRTLTVNTTTGGAGRSGNHLNVNIPALACGSAIVGVAGGNGDCQGSTGFENAFNDTSFTGTAGGLCLNPTSLSDPQCLRVPLGATTQFGNGVPIGSSTNSFFQSTDGTFTQNDAVLIPGTATFQNMDFKNGLKMSMTSIPDPDPANPNGRIHIIHQSIDYSLTQDPHPIGGNESYTQTFKATYDINAVTDASGNLTGTQRTPGGGYALDPRCGSFPGSACGTFTLSIFDTEVDCGTGVDDPVTASGIFNVSPNSPAIGPILPGSPGGSFSISCTPDFSPTGENGCVGPILNPTLYPPGGRFPSFNPATPCLRAGP